VKDEFRFVLESSDDLMIDDTMENKKTTRNTPLVILASNSPRRKWLLEKLGVRFEVLPAQVDEQPFPGEAPREYVQRAAKMKARWVAEHADGSALILAADTIVADDETILGKPVDAPDARRILTSLRGRTHQVFTALSVVRKPAGDSCQTICMTEVRMRNYRDQEMDEYIKSKDPLDKAGAYAIQHAGFHPVERLNGCYANVVGLPLCHLSRILKYHGISGFNNIPAICRQTFGFDCAVYEHILRDGNESAAC